MIRDHEFIDPCLCSLGPLFGIGGGGTNTVTPVPVPTPEQAAPAATQPVGTKPTPTGGGQPTFLGAAATPNQTGGAKTLLGS